MARKIVLGRRTAVMLLDLGKTVLEAKVDTGADGSVLHVEDTTVENGVLRVAHSNGVTTTFDEFRIKKVKSSNGLVEERHAVPLRISIAGRELEAEFSLTNRANMNFPALIGRNVLDNNFVIDTSAEYQTSDRKHLSIGVLSRSKGDIYSTNRILEEGMKRKHNMHLIDYASCYILTGRATDVIHSDGTSIEGLDAIIPRIGSGTTKYGTAIVRQMELQNIFNTARSIAIVRARDKLRSLQILAQKKISVPKTVFAFETIPEKALIAQVGGPPVILKLVTSTHGKGVVIAETTKAAMSVMQAFRSQKLSFILQQFINEAEGRDIRAFVVGNKVVAAMERSSPEGDFRSNLHIGGTGRSGELTRSQQNLAIKAAQAMGLSIAGVDMVQGKRGLMVIEVNASPGLEGIERYTGVNVAGEIIEYVEREIGKKPAKDKVGA